MSRAQMIAIVDALVFGVGGFALWYSRQHPREIVGDGTVRVPSLRAVGGFSIHATREVSINGLRFQEVALPNGTWIACGGDCVKAARDAGEGFWEKQQRDHR